MSRWSGQSLVWISSVLDLILVINKEDLDVEYESFPASALIRPGYDAGIDVEIVACFRGKKKKQSKFFKDSKQSDNLLQQASLQMLEV